jgi:hypothetical protein
VSYSSTSNGPASAVSPMDARERTASSPSTVAREARRREEPVAETQPLDACAPAERREAEALGCRSAPPGSPRTP